MLSVPTSSTETHSERLAQPLLPLKMSAPPQRAGVLLRPDLQALLSEVRLNPLTLVVAPAGYGKTTLLSQWGQELTRTGAPVCWLTLDVGDRNPALFLAYLIGAFQRAFPLIGADAWRILHSAANLERDWPLVAGALCSDLQRNVLTATFLFLDDVHVVTESAVITQILGYLLRAAPPTLHIILASRRAPTFAPLPRLRTEGRLVEINQRDLHLSETEVRQILAAQDVQLDEGELTTLLERTEGWALSVQLAARALAAQPAERRGAFVRALGGGQEQLLSYLATEVLADLPQELIDFLRLAALPVSFDAALLAEVLARDDVDYLLQRAQALGLPILPMNAQGDQLRFHPLWRELLLQDVPQELDQTMLATLHQRFGRALERRGDLREALDHYASAGANDDLARALRERAWPLLRSPQRNTVRRWLEHISPYVRDNDPELLHMWGVSQEIADPRLAAASIERAAELFRQKELYERELRALSDLAALQAWQIRPSSFFALCLRAIRAAHRTGDEWSVGAMRVCVAAILYSKGRDCAALRVISQANTYPLYPTWRWLLVMITSTINTQVGRPERAIAAIDEALQLPQIDLDDRLRLSLLRLRALALYQLGNVVEALSLSQEVHRQLGNYYHGAVAGASATQLALLLMVQGRVDEATTYITQARSMFHEIGDLAPLANLQAIEVYGMLLRGQAANAVTTANSVLRRLQEATQSSTDLVFWLLLALVVGEGGERSRALTLTVDIARRMRERHYRLPLACAQLYHAYLAHQQSDEEQRQAALTEAWDIIASDQIAYLPCVPPAALEDGVVAALANGVDPQTVGRVLRRQMPDHAVELLQSLVTHPQPHVRTSVARLLGDLGASSAYATLRTLLKDRDAAVRQATEDALSRLVYRPNYTLRVRTLGAFGLWRGDQEVRDRDWRSSKARQLFQFLITERGRTLPRERILDTLWPEMEAEAAANNLRVTLNRLSKAIEPDRPEGASSTYVVQQGDTYSFNTSSDCQLDVTEFDTAVTDGQRAERRGQRQVAIVAFRKAVDLYGGPYLPDNMYEDWTVVERERLAMLFNDTAIRLGMLLLEEGLADETIGLGWRVLENDQSHEEAYRLLMRAHAFLGERSTAIRLYQRCVTVLENELGVRPLPETEALYNTLREMR